jgi:hypothetical protein
MVVKMFELIASDLFETKLERKRGKYKKMHGIGARHSDFNIKMMNVFTLPFFFAPIVRDCQLSFSDSPPVHFHYNASKGLSLKWKGSQCHSLIKLGNK